MSAAVWYPQPVYCDACSGHGHTLRGSSEITRQRVLCAECRGNGVRYWIAEGGRFIRPLYRVMGTGIECDDLLDALEHAADAPLVEGDPYDREPDEDALLSERYGMGDDE